MRIIKDILWLPGAIGHLLLLGLFDTECGVWAKGVYLILALLLSPFIIANQIAMFFTKKEETHVP